MSLRRGQDRFREMLELVPAAVAVLDRELNYLFVSKRWLSDFAVPLTDIIGKNHYDVFPEIPEPR
jgi:PAS domain-containing protein